MKEQLSIPSRYPLRVFNRLTLQHFRTFDADGRVVQRVFLGAAAGHLLPEDFANLVERLTGTRPAQPDGVEVVEAVDIAGAAALAAANPDVARALRLVDLMLEGDEEIDWVAGYSALEVLPLHYLFGAIPVGGDR